MDPGIISVKRHLVLLVDNSFPNILYRTVLGSAHPLNNYQFMLLLITELGHSESVGHLDFYPNGGSEQVGCRGSAHFHIVNKKTVADGVLSYIGCNHQRSHEFFTESINSQ